MNPALQSSALATTAAICNDLHLLESPLSLIDLSRPFGLTIILGGTNLRFCVSQGSVEPFNVTVTWNQLARALDGQGDFKKLKGPAFREAIVTFLTKFQEQDFQTPLSLENLRSMNISVAGPVYGEGRDAAITATNTGIDLVSEPIARTFEELFESVCDEMDVPFKAPSEIGVYNDAIAGISGEKLVGGLIGIDTGVYLILGTGVGGAALVDNQVSPLYNELGHRVLLLGDGTTGLFLDGDKLRDILSPEGEFKTISGASYCEHVIAGPWAAVRFVKDVLLKVDTNLIAALSEAVSQVIDRPIEQIQEDLLSIRALSYNQIQDWAKFAPSETVKGINRVIFSHDFSRLLTPSLDYTTSSDMLTVNPNTIVRLKAFDAWKSYFTSLGSTLKIINEAMSSAGHTPKKFILGGGIGEACSRYDEFPKAAALTVICETSGLRPEQVAFSTLSGEARESAITLNSVSNL